MFLPCYARAVQIQEFPLQVDEETISCAETPADDARGRALLMHGAGVGCKDRYLPLLADLASMGITATAFDFSGHGRSSGRVEELSLAKRLRQAESVLAAVNAERLPVLAIGFSMSGQTVCDLLASSVNEIKAAVLGCPAVYAEEARCLEFGRPEFTQVLRRDGSWRSSTAFDALRSFTGPVMVVRPPGDAVIPSAVTQQILHSCPPGVEDVVLDGATHEIYRWLEQRPRARRVLAGRMARLIS
jgi:uncharacterized protein